MSPLRFEHEPDDPNEILQLLPAEQREEFTQEYQVALRAASEPDCYAELRSTLWKWRLRAVTPSGPSERSTARRAFEDQLAIYAARSWAVHAATTSPPWFHATILRILTIAAESGTDSVVPLAESLTRTWARLGVEQSLASKQWLDFMEADDQDALDEAIVTGARRGMAEYIAELSAERAATDVPPHKNGSSAPQPYPRQNGSSRPTLDEVLDRVARRRGGKIGFEEAVNIIESERNER